MNSVYCFYRKVNNMYECDGFEIKKFLMGSRKEGYTNLQYFAPTILTCSDANARPTRTKTKLI